MSGSRDKLHDDDGDLEQLAHELDLDMDAPIGATFAAALRDDDASVQFDDDDFDLPLEEAEERATPSQHANVFGAEPFLQAKSEAAGLPGGGVFADSLESDALETDTYEEESFEDEYEPASDSFAAPMSGLIEEPPYAEPESGVVYDASSADDAPPMQDAADIGEDAGAVGDGLGYDYAFASAAPSSGDRVIPRITVHAFCNRTPVLGLMRTIQKDRRMRNVSMEVHEGGARVAIDHYVNETTPNLLILEGAGDPRQLLADLDSLAEYCDENIRVVVIGDTNDIRLYRELMSRGVSEYLVTPVDPVQMIRSIASLFTDPEAPFMGKSLAVTGVKGGVGASSIAHNLAWALSERIKVNATLVDLDLNFGTTGLDFNQDSGATIADALMSPDRFDDAIMGRLITRATDRLSLFTAPATLDRTYNLDPETYVRVLEQVRSSVPFVVLDMPHIWSDWFKSTIISADEIVVVSGPDLASLRNGKNLIDFLKAARPNDAPPRLVLNMVGLPKRPEIPPKDFGQAIGLEPTMVLPFDAQLFGTAANNGQMIFDVAPESKIAQSIDQLASQLTGREVQVGKPSMLKKLLGR